MEETLSVDRNALDKFKRQYGKEPDKSIYFREEDRIKKLGIKNPLILDENLPLSQRVIAFTYFSSDLQRRISQKQLSASGEIHEKLEDWQDIRNIEQLLIAGSGASRELGGMTESKSLEREVSEKDNELIARLELERYFTGKWAQAKELRRLLYGSMYLSTGILGADQSWVFLRIPEEVRVILDRSIEVIPLTKFIKNTFIYMQGISLLAGKIHQDDNERERDIRLPSIINHLGGRVMANSVVEASNKFKEYIGKLKLFQDSVLTYERLRLSRTSLLAEVDPEVAIAYQGFSCFRANEFIRYLEGMTKSEASPQEYHTTLLEDVRMDTNFYNSLVDQIEFVRRNRVTVPEKVEVEEKKEIRPVSAIVSSLINGHSERMTEDTRMRISYFAEDARKYGLTGQKEAELADVLGAFNLAKQYRRREGAPKDVHIRNFFDDLTLGYVRNGVVPSLNEVRRVYDAAVK